MTNYIRLGLGLIAALAMANPAPAQYIQWTLTPTKYPCAGSTKSTLQVNGLITYKFGPGNVTIEAWPSNDKNHGALVTPFTILAKNLVDNKNGTFSFAMDNMTVGQPGVAYNVVATVPLGLLTARTQPAVATSAAK